MSDNRLIQCVGQQTVTVCRTTDSYSVSETDSYFVSDNRQLQCVGQQTVTVCQTTGSHSVSDNRQAQCVGKCQVREGKAIIKHQVR